MTSTPAKEDGLDALAKKTAAAGYVADADLAGWRRGDETER